MSHTHSMQGTLVWGNSAWGDYVVQPIGIGEDMTYKVLTGKGKPASKHIWHTYDGAAACAELLAEGHFKEA